MVRYRIWNILYYSYLVVYVIFFFTSPQDHFTEVHLFQEPPWKLETLKLKILQPQSDTSFVQNKIHSIQHVKRRRLRDLLPHLIVTFRFEK